MTAHCLLVQDIGVGNCVGLHLQQGLYVCVDGVEFE
jgi:hypothetical protein